MRNPGAGQAPTLAERARALNAAARRGHARAQSLPALILMTDARRLPDPAAAIRRLPRGAAVILRHPEARARAALAIALLPLCRRRGVRLLIAADAALARRLRADGVHLPEAMLGRARLGPRPRRWLVTAAAHGARGLRAAAGAGADAVLLAPVFRTPSHPEVPPLGVLRFAALVRAARLPVYALGGIDALAAARLRGSGAVGIAAIGALAPPGLETA
ncbi:MAG: thiamine phosphate synthase [Alphaproteobacteria bacterium]|nr:thiamine phosphate synthase [Alphaproteobacteria bacterium]